MENYTFLGRFRVTAEDATQNAYNSPCWILSVWHDEDTGEVWTEDDTEDTDTIGHADTPERAAAFVADFFAAPHFKKLAK